MIIEFKKIFNPEEKIKFINPFYLIISRVQYIQKENEVFFELKKLEQLDSSDKCKLQEKKLLNLLSYAYENCPYYKYLFDKEKINIKDINCLNKIPFLTKSKIRKNGNEIISKSIKKRDLVKRNTGGSTGEPLEFYSDKLAGVIDAAHHRYLYTIMGYKHGDVIADSGGIFIPKKLRDKNIYWLKYPKNTVWGHIGHSALYLTDSTIKCYIENLLEVKPAILRGYPSFWNKIAEHILFKNIKLNFKVKGVNLTAEMCSDEQKENIEKAFSSMIYFEYGHSEISIFCYTDDNKYMYKSSPIYGYIEVIKDNGEPARVNEEGEIIATSFCNRGMPFIRYRTGDRVKLSYKNGGIIHFKRIQGRAQDFIMCKNKQKIFLTALIFGQHFRAFRKISKWQLVQNEPGKVTIKIVKLKGYSQEDENEIKEKIQDVADIELSFDYVSEIPLTQRGKHMFLNQNIRITQ